MGIFPGDAEGFLGSIEIVSGVKMNTIRIISSDKGSVADTDSDRACAVLLRQKRCALLRRYLFHEKSRNPQGTVFFIASKDQDFIQQFPGDMFREHYR